MVDMILDNIVIVGAVAGACLLCVLILVGQFSRAKKLSIELNALEEIYKPVTMLNEEHERWLNRYKTLQKKYQNNRTKLANYKQMLYNNDLSIGTVDNELYQIKKTTEDLAELLNDADKLKTKLKEMVQNKTACSSGYSDNFTVNGKRSEAKKLFNREVKLRLRAIDNEFKAAAAQAQWFNINRLIKNLNDTFVQINKSGEITKTKINQAYFKLKMDEFITNYTIKILKQEIKDNEREEARLKREAEREEKKITAAIIKAEKTRKIMEKLVQEELSKLDSATDEQKALLALHQEELNLLKQREQRAKSLAQTTRAGYVYVISNTKSFGEGVCKIGMTRRADPNERIKELGDASVPELFDIHAFIYTTDAPELESYIHKQLDEKRVNLVNRRKEFFIVSPNQVMDIVHSYSGNIEIIFDDTQSQNKERVV